MKPMSSEGPISVLNIVISTPKARGGAIRAGLQFGDHLMAYTDVDTVKMRGDHDELLADELDLKHEFHTTPSRTFFRDIGDFLVGSNSNYENTVIWTELSTPKPLSEYDLAHIHNAVPLWGLLAASIRCRGARIPYVMTTHGISKIPELPRSMNMSSSQTILFENAFLKPYRYVLRNAEHLFALSERNKERIDETFSGTSSSIVPNGVPLNRDGSDARLADLELPEDRPLLLFVGKISQSKGVEDLLEAYQNVSTECTLVVAGPPADEYYVERLRQFDYMDVRYLGYTDYGILQALYRRADLFVFPTRSDVFPLVTLEALAAGTPVISTTVGGIPEQITHDTGVLVPPKQAGELAHVIDKLLEDDSRRIAMSDAAFSRAETEYSWDAVARKTANVYERICSRTTDRATRVTGE